MKGCIVRYYFADFRYAPRREWNYLDSAVLYLLSPAYRWTVYRDSDPRQMHILKRLLVVNSASRSRFAAGESPDRYFLLW
ncbi:hypothetical protein D3C75_846860 [compost metagenome]